ncbi:MAG: PQQ-dependent sugar dehydrogenase [Nitriliruptorales bacterium]|nr:PQQ-dependent sugar dehydrogenase [Nitriliruptorales bacterium]
MATVPAAASAAPQIRLVEVVSGLSAPTFLDAPPGDDRLFVLEQPGRVRVVDGGRLLSTPFLDITDLTDASGERGLLGLAFDPSFDGTGRFYVFFTESGSGDLRIERYRASADPNRADRGSRSLVIEIPHRDFSNHNGGMLAFGPDGMLYAALGDGGGSGDPLENGEDTSTLLGSILRLDVSGSGGGYAVPADNPFVGHSGRDEIWHYGLRNPWRFSFDPPADRLLIGDVGQGSREEVDAVSTGSSGLDFGWDAFEGSSCFEGPCDETGKTFPAYEYSHSSGSVCSVIGGYVYRGEAIPELRGRYVFGDLCGGWIRALTLSGNRSTGLSTLATDVGTIRSFGQDAASELYVLTSQSVFRLAPPPAVGIPGWYLSNSLAGGEADLAFTYGRPDDLPIAGDWDGDGDTTAGVRRGATWYLRNRVGGGAADLAYRYGRTSDTAVVGDWDGDGKATPGVVRGAWWYLRDRHAGGVADRTFRYGRVGDAPVVGDWDGDGDVTVAVRRGATWYLRNRSGGGIADIVVTFGRSSDIPVVGDWDADGRDEIGVRRGATWYLVDDIRGGAADRVVTYGRSTDLPVPGDWDGDGRATLGVVRTG